MSNGNNVSSCRAVFFMYQTLYCWNWLGEAAEEAFEEDEDGSILERLSQFPKIVWAG